MPSTDRKLELKAKTSVAQTASQAAVYAKGLNMMHTFRFFSSLKCCLFHNATFFLVPVLFAFCIQGVLKFKCQIPVPKGKRVT
jgi:hypothetical protein